VRRSGRSMNRKGRDRGAETRLTERTRKLIPETIFRQKRLFGIFSDACQIWPGNSGVFIHSYALGQSSLFKLITQTSVK